MHQTMQLDHANELSLLFDVITFWAKLVRRNQAGVRVPLRVLVAGVLHNAKRSDFLNQAAVVAAQVVSARLVG